MKPYPSQISSYQNTTMTDHFTIFVYPFEHGLTSADQEDFLENTWQAGWRPRIDRLGEGDEIRKCLKRLRFRFYPTMLKAVYPDLYPLTTETEISERAETDPLQRRAELLYENISQCRTRKAYFRHVHGELNPKTESICLTRRLGEKGISGRYRFPTGEADENICLRVRWMDAYLFPNQVGFLCIKVILQTPDWQKETLSDRLMQFHRHFQQIDTRAKASLLSKWVYPLKSDNIKYLKRDALSGLERYITRFHLFSFISLYNPYGSFEPRAEPDGFHYGIDRYYQGIDRLDGLLYEVASVSEPNTLIYIDRHQPSREYLQEILMRKIALWRYRRGMALKDTVCFISLENKGQPSATVYEEIYFPLYIYLLYLKIRLFQFSGQLGLKHLTKHKAKAHQVLKAFLIFRNEFWHNNEFPHPETATVFKKFRDALAIDTAYERIAAQIKDLLQYQQIKLMRALNMKIWILIILFIALLVANI